MATPARSNLLWLDHQNEYSPRRTSAPSSEGRAFVINVPSFKRLAIRRQRSCNLPLPDKEPTFQHATRNLLGRLDVLLGPHFRKSNKSATSGRQEIDLRTKQATAFTTISTCGCGLRSVEEMVVSFAVAALAGLLSLTCVNAARDEADFLQCVVANFNSSHTSASSGLAMGCEWCFVAQSNSESPRLIKRRCLADNDAQEIFPTASKQEVLCKIGIWQDVNGTICICRESLCNQRPIQELQTLSE
ncbi:unnamed protein product [Soboliphyme baturini]|uniref:Protein quiver n=1 Tax=Soboliphyme baturini TaxID=241478 RepID=A0A183IVZ4_9BILA|nr:unnamed protein product [Soboliphyme baturini]